MEMRPGNAQWIGRREGQEDAFGFAGFDQDQTRRHSGVLVVLADGMGGLKMGGEASRLAVKTMLAAYRAKRSEEPIPDALMRALKQANRAVYDLACGGDGEGRVGTTLVAAVVQGEQLYWVAVGDSRLYLFRGSDGTLTQCTQDHNYGNDLLLRAATGELSREEAETDPDRDALVSFVGEAEIRRVDCNLRALTLTAGDRLLLCSDGVHGVLSEAELRAALAGDAQAAADALIDAVKAKRLERQDNATVALIACGPAPQTLRAPRPAPAARSWRPLRLAILGLLLAVVVGMWVGQHLDTWLAVIFPATERTGSVRGEPAVPPSAANSKDSISTETPLDKTEQPRSRAAWADEKKPTEGNTGGKGGEQPHANREAGAMGAPVKDKSQDGANPSGDKKTKVAP